MSAVSDTSVREWLAAWGACVARVDIDEARHLFDDDVVGFGTRAEVAVGLDALVTEQWRHVWPAIADFAFDVDGAHVYLSSDGLLAVIATTWTSTGRGGAAEAGPRPGRATIVCRRESSGGPWRGVHTHFSLTPAGT
jgi:ketosteroid isomerase-like protein